MSDSTTIQMRMKGLYLEQGEIGLRDDLSRPSPGDGQVLLKTRLAGICGTDLGLLRGYAGFYGVPGHEFVADVVEVGKGVDKRWLGQRVAAEINQWCGECEQCRLYQYSHCVKRTVVGIRDHQGAFAQYLVVAAKTLHRVPEALTDEQAVFVEPLAAALRILEQEDVRQYGHVLLIGAGRLGQLIARVLAARGCLVSVVVRHTEQSVRLSQLVRVKCISEHDVIPRSVDAVVEASGHPSGLELALKALKPNGVCILKSTFSGRCDIDLSSWVVHELRLLGSRCGPFDEALAILASREVDPLPLIDGRYPLSRGVEAFAHAQRKGTMKILLDMS